MKEIDEMWHRRMKDEIVNNKYQYNLIYKNVLISYYQGDGLPRMAVKIRSVRQTI
jgi:hypothetical protein